MAVTVFGGSRLSAATCSDQHRFGGQHDRNTRFTTIGNHAHALKDERIGQTVTCLKMAGTWHHFATVMYRYLRYRTQWYTVIGARFFCPHIPAGIDRGSLVQNVNHPHRITNNAHMKSWNESIESDMYHRHHFTGDNALRAAILSYVDFYNCYRLHSALGCRLWMEFDTPFFRKPLVTEARGATHGI